MISFLQRGHYRNFILEGFCPVDIAIHFGVTAAKLTDLYKAFSYPITSLPLSIASSDSSLYQSDKAGFRSYIMKSSNSVPSPFPQNVK